jgi:hypothetical protein
MGTGTFRLLLENGKWKMKGILRIWKENERELA